ncbi:uncharacterized protein LOC128882631 isoform X3 [Hylaeus volcanicus]|uniref:uncharacterized protein LOC128882631 isoform X3 n=1 Tax=Hylaeus volcanicus TaxID=313075 RepID=UPI0023B84C91|nr:uncharacterized protein LOC128882631 isoform X3 [Hylaeus volcanicus]
MIFFLYYAIIITLSCESFKLTSIKHKSLSPHQLKNHPPILSKVLDASAFYIQSLTQDSKYFQKNIIWKKLCHGNNNLFPEMYNAVYDQFDHEGYNTLLDSVFSKNGQERFVQALERLSYILPHCDSKSLGVASEDKRMAPFPGGPFRRAYGFDMTQWITSQILTVANNAGNANPGVALMAMMASTSVVGVVSTVAASLIDIVPPLIPPPIWILRPFPCLPMITGMNCLLSVLYPITIADFTIAHVTDQSMNGVLSSFPSKFNSKVGKASIAVYNLCAAVYLGMYCASLFPMCWLPVGLMEAQSFPVCFPQCLLVLVACPGFWLDDILGPCSSVSVPPFCAFSVFVNKNLIPPQYTSYEEQHPYPSECPHYDPEYDISPHLYERVPELSSPILDEVNTSFRLQPAGPSLFKNSDYNAVSPIHRVCDCHPTLCEVKAGDDCPQVTKKQNQACKDYCSSISESNNTNSTPKLMETLVVHLAEENTPIHQEIQGHIIPVS